jgi:hypothetical protein
MQGGRARIHIVAQYLCPEVRHAICFKHSQAWQLRFRFETHVSQPGKVMQLCLTLVVGVLSSTTRLGADDRGHVEQGLIALDHLNASILF